MSDFEVAIVLDPFWAYPRHNLALAHLAEGDGAEAHGAYEQGLLFAGYYGLDTGYLHHNSGALYAREQQWDLARDEFNGAAEAFHSEYLNCEEVRVRAVGDHDTATEKWAKERAAGLARAQADAINAIGTTYAVNGAYGRAEAEYRKAIQLDSDSLEAHRNLGLAILRRAHSEDQFNEALGEFTLTKQLADSDDGPPLQFRARVDLGEFFLRSARTRKVRSADDRRKNTADYSLAADQFSAALTYFPADVRALENLKAAQKGRGIP